MLKNSDVIAVNKVLVKCIGILSATRKMIREAGLDLPVLTNTERSAREVGKVLQAEIKRCAEVQARAGGGNGEDPGPPVGPEKTQA